MDADRSTQWMVRTSRTLALLRTCLVFVALLWIGIAAGPWLGGWDAPPGIAWVLLTAIAGAVFLLICAAVTGCVHRLKRYGRHQSLRCLRLRAARDRAQRLVDCRGNLLALMSHEVRTPLHAVLGMAELMQSQPLDAVQRRRVGTIIQSGQHIMNLLNDVLDAAKAESGTLSLTPQAFDAAATAGFCAQLLQARARQRGLSLKVDLDAASGLLAIGDPCRVRQVLTNLLANAIKFTAAGEVRLVVAPTNQHIEFRIEDTGAGIDEASAARLFKPFVQLDETTGTCSGSGLGLWISSELVRLMGGTLRVSSVPDRGSCFGFALPRADAASTASPSRPPAAMPQFGAQAQLLRMAAQAAA